MLPHRKEKVLYLSHLREGPVKDTAVMKYFFAQTVDMKLVLPQAAQLSMSIFIEKSVVLHLQEGHY